MKINKVYNEDIFDEIRAADNRALATGMGRAPFEILAPLYVRANAFNVDLDAPISRICRLDHLIEDLERGTLTHIRASASIWNDPLENPLFDVGYPDPISGGSIDLNPIVGSFYALCWTKETTENMQAWNAFAKTPNYVRLTTTPRKLLERLMRREDEYYMFHHYIGGVSYRSPTDIETWRDSTDYPDHLDSLGHGIITSLTVIREGFQSEQEVRLLYSHMPDSSDWVKNNVPADESLAKIPFDWGGLVDGVILCPRMTKSEATEASKRIAAAGITCAVVQSRFS